ncbi:MAG: 4a-hydroxytetrahydrobiopterin dehydratase [Myxococcales bacterium]|nr:4a-hydroxytetrahydrobiopterin dehydratase [Myxococcales bacterium]MDD9966010.1 4a-hydroxytetrahydrobiopterin dehydratase [Myxococcales bacterium]
MTRRKLNVEEQEARAKEFPAWSMVAGKLQREFLFEDFVEAFGFMSRVALIAESMDHHPDLHNVYNRVTLQLHTHDVGGISELDFELAARIDRLLGTSKS